MFRYYLVRGVSAGALALLCVSKGPGASALAQEALPAIDIDAAAASGGNGAPPPPSTPTPSTWSPTLANGEPAFVERFQLPNTVSSVTREDIEEKVNIIDTEDALKYTPSLFLRKRNNGTIFALELLGFTLSKILPRDGEVGAFPAVLSTTWDQNREI